MIYLHIAAKSFQKNRAYRAASRKACAGRGQDHPAGGESCLAARGCRPEAAGGGVAHIVPLLFREHHVLDLAVQGTAIEEVVRRIYEGRLLDTPAETD